MNEIIAKGKKFLTSPQTTIISAASIIMVMIVASRVLGLVRQRVLAHFFPPADLSLFFAAFRLSDLIFEVVVFGTLSSAFIPVFTKYFEKDEREAWLISARVIDLGLLIFVPLALTFSLLAEPIYSVLTEYSPLQVKTIAPLARILFAAQGFFVISYVVTGVLESLKRFLVPALAPLFYNLGIILGTIFLTPALGLTAPAVGVVLGALMHLLIQLPLAFKLGLRFAGRIKVDEGVKKIAKLAAPRVLDLSFQQVAKTVELSLASAISTAAYTYVYFANSLQLLPVSLFGTSLAKAALPTLTRLEETPREFTRVFLTTFYQVLFLTLPLAAFLIVLRIPLVRLVFGTDIFDWEATIQTGLVLSAFAVGVPFQAAIALLARAFYALHNTKTPVTVSIVAIALNVTLSILAIKLLHLPAWALAASFSTGVTFQAITLFWLLNHRLKENFWRSLGPISKSLLATLAAGGTMFFILKFFDRAVWVKRLSFLGHFDAVANLPFESFVLDTRYTFNLLLLTLIVALVGGMIYVLVSWLLRSQELVTVLKLIRRRKLSLPAKESETISPPANLDSN